MTKAEIARFNELDAKVKTGAAAWLEACIALKEIRDKRLYRHTHGNFDLYVRHVIGKHPGCGVKMVQAAEVVMGLLGDGVPPELAPQSMGAAQAMASVPAGSRTSLWASLVSGGNTTKEAVMVAKHRLAGGDRVLMSPSMERFTSMVKNPTKWAEVVSSTITIEEFDAFAAEFYRLKGVPFYADDLKIAA